MARPPSRRLALLPPLAALVAMLALLFTLPRATARALVEEGGPVESATVVGYAAAAALALLRARAGGWRAGYAAALLLLVFALREADFQERFTTDAIDEVDFYLSPAVPLVEKAVALLALLALAALAVGFVRATWAPFASAVRGGDPAALAVLAGVVLALGSLGLDEAHRTIRAAVGPGAALAARIVEETLELGIPLFWLVALALGGRGDRAACRRPRSR